MNMLKRIFKNLKASQLVEKILVAAFSVSMGGALIAYGVNVINESKNTDLSDDFDNSLYNYNQKASNITATSRNRGLTFNFSSDGSTTVNGTITGSNGTIGFSNDSSHITKGHECFFTVTVQGELSGDYDLTLTVQWATRVTIPRGNYVTPQTFAAISTYNRPEERTGIMNYMAPGLTFDNFVISDIMVIDLTDWFGAGNEPSVERFRRLFPHSYYPTAKESRQLSRQEINDLGRD